MLDALVAGGGIGIVRGKDAARVHAILARPNTSVTSQLCMDPSPPLTMQPLITLDAGG
jgi:hypothetical protein